MFGVFRYGWWSSRWWSRTRRSDLLLMLRSCLRRETPSHHPAEHSHHLSRILEAFIIHAFFCFVYLADGESGCSSALFALTEAVVEVSYVLDFY